MPWMVLFDAEFDEEFRELPPDVQDELVKRLGLLKEYGPTLGRPNVDTLNGSSFANMKELRFRLDGLWRFAFAFDPQRRAIVLCGGDKHGARQGDFYRELIAVADRRFAKYVAGLKRKEG